MKYGPEYNETVLEVAVVDSGELKSPIRFLIVSNQRNSELEE